MHYLKGKKIHVTVHTHMHLNRQVFFKINHKEDEEKKKEEGNTYLWVDYTVIIRFLGTTLQLF